MSELRGTGKRAKNVTETEDYVAFLARAIDGYGKRIAEDPVAAAYATDLQTRLSDAVNVGIATAQTKQGGWSMREIAGYLGVSHVAIIGRVKRGKIVIAAREATAGVVRLSMARRPSVPALRQQRADHLAEVGREDYRVIEIGRHRKAS